jgi:hypothetical protein
VTMLAQYAGEQRVILERATAGDDELHGGLLVV